MKSSKYGGFIIFNGRIYRAEEIINALLSQHTTEIRFLNEFLIIGSYQIAPLKPTNEDIEQIMDMTCYGSLAYCCSLEKKCDIRDNVLHLLNITPEEFENIKKQAHNNFVFLAKQKMKNRLLRSSTISQRGNDGMMSQQSGPHAISRQSIFEEDSFWKDVNEQAEMSFGPLEQDLFSTKEDTFHNSDHESAKIGQGQKDVPTMRSPVRDVQRYSNKEQKNVKICKYCGASIPEYAKFCPACGRPITD
ncbi:MAG: zinc-ribbon domain-containing protein [Candidatus Odinarchaeota archaeon]|nr:zinc-ribbon domain-containing protein [Candidatus Odinarchaeota archaeon]